MAARTACMSKSSIALLETIIGSEQRVFVRLGPLWYQAVNTYSSADDKDATALKELITICANISTLSYARHLMSDDELEILQKWIAELQKLIHKHAAFRVTLERKHKIHQLSHVLDGNHHKPSLSVGLRAAAIINASYLTPGIPARRTVVVDNRTGKFTITFRNLHSHQLILFLTFLSEIQTVTAGPKVGDFRSVSDSIPRFCSNSAVHCTWNVVNKIFWQTAKDNDIRRHGCFIGQSLQHCL